MSSLNSLWLAQARRIGCQTHAVQEEKKTTTENTDCFNSVTDEVSHLCNNLKLEPKKSNEDLSSIDWKTECIAGLKLRQLLDNGKAWAHEELVNLVKSPGRCLNLSLMRSISTLSFLKMKMLGLQLCITTLVTLLVAQLIAVLLTRQKVLW